MTERIFVTILAGYLGAGKTTILNSVLCGEHGMRLAVLVNDFGKVNIDAGLVRNSSGDTIELTNGCVCCTIGDDLGETLTQLRNQQCPPDRVIIEASGVTDPSRLAMQSGHWPGFSLSSIIVAVDAETIRKRAKDKFVSHLIQTQIRSADTIAITKGDLVTQDEAASILKWLSDQNPEARLYPATFGQLPEYALFEARGRDLGSVEEFDNEISHGFHTRVWRPPAPIDVSELQKRLNELPESIQRVKGTIIDEQSGDPVLIQMVGSRLEIHSGTTNVEPCLILIGVHDPQALDDAYDRLSSLSQMTVPETQSTQGSRVQL